MWTKGALQDTQNQAWFVNKRSKIWVAKSPYFGPFFKVPDPKAISGRPDELEDWVQIDWATMVFNSKEQGDRQLMFVKTLVMLHGNLQ